MGVTAASWCTWKAGSLAALLPQGNGSPEVHTHSLKVAQPVGGPVGNLIQGVSHYDVVIRTDWLRALHCKSLRWLERVKSIPNIDPL